MTDQDFDLEAAYTESILPLMEQVSDKCKELGIPFTAAFAVAVEGDQTKMRTFHNPGVMVIDVLAIFASLTNNKTELAMVPAHMAILPVQGSPGPRSLHVVKGPEV